MFLLTLEVGALFQRDPLRVPRWAPAHAHTESERRDGRRVRGVRVTGSEARAHPRSCGMAMGRGTHAPRSAACRPQRTRAQRWQRTTDGYTCNNLITALARGAARARPTYLPTCGNQLPYARLPTNQPPWWHGGKHATPPGYTELHIDHTYGPTHARGTRRRPTLPTSMPYPMQCQCKHRGPT